MNRLKQYLDDEEPLMPEGDYYWLVFRDLNGAYRRLRTEVIESLYECTVKQRAYRRAFDRDRRLEKKADRRPWEDYD